MRRKGCFGHLCTDPSVSYLAGCISSSRVPSSLQISAVLAHSMEEKINLLVPKLEFREGGLPRMSGWLIWVRTGDCLRDTAKAGRDHHDYVAAEGNILRDVSCGNEK